MLGRDGASRDDAQPVHDERGAPPFGLGFAHDGALDDLRAAAHVVRGVEIPAHHPADALGEGAGEAQGRRDGILPLQRKLLGRTGDLEVQLAPQTQEDLLGLLEFLQVGRGQETGGGQPRGTDPVARGACDPDAALDVTERADAVLEVGLLQVRAAAGLFPTFPLRLDDLPREGPPGLAGKERRGLGLELGIELG